MSSTKLFRKHFGDQSASVDLKHPNIEMFFNELNEECLLEDKQKERSHYIKTKHKKNNMKKILTISAMMLLLVSCVGVRPATQERDAKAIAAAKEKFINGQGQAKRNGKVVVAGNGYRVVFKN